MRNNKSNNNNGRSILSDKKISKNKKKEDGLVHPYMTLPIGLQGSTPYPPGIEVTLPYIGHNIVLQDGSNAFALLERKLNDVYDPDPGVGSSAPAGFANWARVYQQYKVVGTKVTVRACSNEVRGLMFYVIFRDRQPSLDIANWDKAIDSAEVAPTSGMYTIGALSGQSLRDINCPYLENAAIRS